MKIKIPAMGFLLKSVNTDADIVNAEFGPNCIDQDKVRKFSSLSQGNLRLSSGRYYTSSGYEARKKKILCKKLP